MRIVIGYAPYHNLKGTPLLSQNRQFQWSKSGTLIYPVVMAQAASLMQSIGHEVIWFDGIAENQSWQSYLTTLMVLEPDLILWETKTPLIKKTWEYVNAVKRVLPECSVALCGDHVTALPYETLTNCAADLVLIGGHYDKELFQLVQGYPYEFELPPTNRRLSKWGMYSERNGNFARTPGTYTMFARDCWHRKDGGCTFCSWTNLYKNYSCCSNEYAMQEIEECASLGIREVFDDSGTFPAGKWMYQFCEDLIRWNERNKKHAITMGGNFRSAVLRREDWRLLRRAGFRLVLLGFESANENTLEKLNKLYTVQDCLRSCADASASKLDVHLTFMVGFPWETKKDAARTCQLAKDLFRKGHAKTVQATVCIPYPGTRLFKESEQNDWLLTRDWNDYDMSRPVLKTEMAAEEVMNMARSVYKSCLTPRYLLRAAMRENPRTLIRYAKYLWDHIK